MITRTDLWMAAKEHRNVSVAFNNAIQCLRKFAAARNRHEQDYDDLGFFTKVKLTYLLINAKNTHRTLVEQYSAATGQSLDPDDMRRIGDFVTIEAEFLLLPPEEQKRRLVDHLPDVPGMETQAQAAEGDAERLRAEHERKLAELLCDEIDRELEHQDGK